VIVKWIAVMQMSAPLIDFSNWP